MNSRERLSTGIAELDEILGGGLVEGSLCMVGGGPGTGKTTLGLHFLTAGAVRAQRNLLISLETEEEIRRNATGVGFDLREIEFLDLNPISRMFGGETYNIFVPGEAEREPITRRLLEAIKRVRPHRVFVDDISQLRSLAQNEVGFRRQMVSLLEFLLQQNATVLLTAGLSTTSDAAFELISDTLIELQHNAEGRELRVVKFRGSDFAAGDHSLRLTHHGMEVSPCLALEKTPREYVAEPISSGIAELDEMLHGGLERGTINIITGPSGVGKTSITLQFVKEAARHGERSAVFTFEEGRDTMLRRSEAIHVPMHDMIKRGTLSVVQVEPMAYTANELAGMIRQQVIDHAVRIVMIDSVAGYRLSVRGSDLITQLHLLTRYLKNMGVTVLLVNEVENVAGDFRSTELGIGYLADNILFMRYVEMGGELRKAIGVLKKRMTDFERTLREVRISDRGLIVGTPLTGLRGILGGVPELLGGPQRAAA